MDPPFDDAPLHARAVNEEPDLFRAVRIGRAISTCAPVAINDASAKQEWAPVHIPFLKET